MKNLKTIVSDYLSKPTDFVTNLLNQYNEELLVEEGQKIRTLVAKELATACAGLQNKGKKLAEEAD